MDHVTRLDLGMPLDADHRGGVRPLPVGPEGRARRRLQGAARPRRPRSTGDRPRRSSTTSRRRCTPRKIISYAQGYALMRAAAKEYKWELNTAASR